MIISIKMQEDAPLAMVRLRVVKLLGHLGGKINKSLVTGKQRSLEFSARFYFTTLVWMLNSCPEILLLIIVLYSDT